MKKIIHLIPYDGTGGVEVAANTMRHVKADDLEFCVQSVYPHVPGYQERQVTYGIRPLLSAFARTHAQRPDLLIVSLWRAGIVGILVKLLHPRMELVLMLHSTNHAHWVDRLVTNVAGILADEVWGDSGQTLNTRIRISPHKTRRVISFVTRRLASAVDRPLRASFVFWGRLSAIKGLDRAISIFARVARVYSDARFVIIGPDGGALHQLQELVVRLGLSDHVQFRGEMTMDAIVSESAQASFYLQASTYEGMAMSVVEAMQLGLVPVVTPVGEIRNYCRDGENGVLIRSEDQAANDVLNLLQAPDRYNALRRSAAEAWTARMLYRDSMLAACREALHLVSGNAT